MYRRRSCNKKQSRSFFQIFSRMSHFSGCSIFLSVRSGIIWAPSLTFQWMCTFAFSMATPFVQSLKKSRSREVHDQPKQQRVVHTRTFGAVCEPGVSAQNNITHCSGVSMQDYKHFGVTRISHWVLPLSRWAPGSVDPQVWIFKLISSAHLLSNLDFNIVFMSSSWVE